MLTTERAAYAATTIPLYAGALVGCGIGPLLTDVFGFVPDMSEVLEDIDKEVKLAAINILFESPERIHDQRELRRILTGSGMQQHHVISKKGYATLQEELLSSSLESKKELAIALKAMDKDSPANKACMLKSDEVAEKAGGEHHRGPHSKDALDRVAMSIKKCIDPVRAAESLEEIEALDKVPKDSKIAYAMYQAIRRERNGLLIGKNKLYTRVEEKHANR